MWQPSEVIVFLHYCHKIMALCEEPVIHHKNMHRLCLQTCIVEVMSNYKSSQTTATNFRDYNFTSVKFSLEMVEMSHPESLTGIHVHQKEHHYQTLNFSKPKL